MVKKQLITSYFHSASSEQGSEKNDHPSLDPDASSSLSLSPSSRKRQRCQKSNNTNNHPSSSFLSSSSRKVNVLRSQNGGSMFGLCPVCNMSFSWYTLESHASECNQNDEGISSCNAVVVDKRYGLSKGAAISRSSNNTLSNHQSVPSSSPSLSSASSSPMMPTNPNPNLNPNPNPNPNPIHVTIKGNNKSNNENNNTSMYKIASIFHCNSLSSSKMSKKKCVVPGLYVYEDFITKEDELKILNYIDFVDKVRWKSSTFNGSHIGKRWGVHCNLRKRCVEYDIPACANNPIPDVIQDLVLSRLKSDLPRYVLKDCIPNEANTIDYRKQLGHYLKSHIDDRKLSKEAIINVSLAGDCYMTFTKICAAAKHNNNNNNNNNNTNNNAAVPKQQVKVLLKRRCLQVMTGKARYEYTHGITNHDLLSERRVSITMRDSPLTIKK